MISLLLGNGDTSISHLKTTLQKHFPITDLGNLKYFLGIEMASSHKGLFLNQRKYVLDLFRDAEMMDAKLAPYSIG